MYPDKNWHPMMIMIFMFYLSIAMDFRKKEKLETKVDIADAAPSILFWKKSQQPINGRVVWSSYLLISSSRSSIVQSNSIKKKFLF